MAADKIILGLDPGTNVMGFGIISIKNQKLKALQYGVIKMNNEKNHVKKLNLQCKKGITLGDSYLPKSIIDSLDL